MFRLGANDSCTRVDLVEDAAIDLAYDGTSLWTSSPGAVYRIQIKALGPKADVWWVPGGSHSLQELGASTGKVWIATEDRGVVFLEARPKRVARDRDFIVLDRSAGLPTSWVLSASPWPTGGALVASLRQGAMLIRSGGEAQPLDLPVGNWGLSTATTDGGVWLGTQDGATFVSQDAPETAHRVTGLPDERVHTIFVDPARSTATEELVWLGTENGLAYVRRPVVTVAQQPADQPSDAVTGLP